MVGTGLAAAIDPGKDAGGIFHVEHRVAVHLPASIARMRVVGVFDADCPVVLQRVLQLRGDLRIGQVGQVGKLALGDAVAVVGDHDGGSLCSGGGRGHEVRSVGAFVVEADAAPGVDRGFQRRTPLAGVLQDLWAFIPDVAHHRRVAFQLADHRAGVDVIHIRHAHPLADDAEVHVVVLPARAGAVPCSVQVQDHVVLARPQGHAPDRGAAYHRVDHDDDTAQAPGEFRARVHLFHRAGGHVQAVALDFAARSARLVDRFHAVQKPVTPVHEGLRVDVLVILHEVVAAFQAFMDHASMVAARQAQLGLGGRTEQRAAEFVHAIALHHHTGDRALEGLQVSHRGAHVFQAQGLDGLEAEHIADDRGRQVGDGAAFEQVDVVGDVFEVLRFGLGAWRGIGHGIDAACLVAVQIAGGQAVGPHHRPGGGAGLAGHRQGTFFRVHTFLRRDAEHGDQVDVLGHVVGLPAAHLLVPGHACAAALPGVLDLSFGCGCIHGMAPEVSRRSHF